MEYEAINNFFGKNVKLVMNNGFILKGTILKVYKETVLFKTYQATSAIAITDIKSVREVTQ